MTPPLWNVSKISKNASDYVAPPFPYLANASHRLGKGLVSAISVIDKFNRFLQSKRLMSNNQFLR